MFQRTGNVTSSLLPATETLIIHQYEPNVVKLRLCIDPTNDRSVRLATRLGYKQLYCYECSRYRHHNAVEAQDKINRLYFSVEKYMVKPLERASDFHLIGPSRSLEGLEIIDSPLFPASVFFSPDFVFTATPSNLEIIREQLGYHIVVGGREESGHWTLRALSYGGKAEYTHSPTWSSTLTGVSINDTMPLLLKHVQLALDWTLSIGTTPNLQMIWCFNSLEVQKQCHYVLSDLLGFEVAEQFAGDGDYKQFGIFECGV